MVISEEQEKKVPLNWLIPRIPKTNRKSIEIIRMLKISGIADIRAPIDTLSPWFLETILNGLITLSILSILSV
jgi:hypothetical protein